VLYTIPIHPSLLKSQYHTIIWPFKKARNHKTSWFSGFVLKHGHFFGGGGELPIWAKTLDLAKFEEKKLTLEPQKSEKR
jgi:hypothetical protein